MIGQPILSAILLLLAVSFILDGAVVGIWTIYDHALPKIFPTSNIVLGDIVISTSRLYCAIAAMVVFGLSSLFYRRSRWGLLMRATADSHQIAQARGISVARVFSLTWIIGGVVLTIGGILIAVRVSLGLNLTLIAFSAFPAVMLGGLDSIAGALVGAFVVGICESLIGGYVSSWVMGISPYIIVMLVLIFLPYGIFGLKRIERI
jgi:branched-chain amino acid transport system permease protein